MRKTVPKHDQERFALAHFVWTDMRPSYKQKIDGVRSILVKKNPDDFGGEWKILDLMSVAELRKILGL